MTRVAPTTVYSEHARRAQRVQLAYLRREGRYLLDGARYVSFGNNTELDGAATAWWGFTFQPTTELINFAIAGRYATPPTGKQWFARISSLGYLSVRIMSDLAGNGPYASGTQSVALDGTRHSYLVLYSGAAPVGQRLRILLRTRPPGGGWTAWADDLSSTSGTMPATLVTPSTSADLRLGRFDSGEQSAMLCEDFRWGTTLPTALQRSVMSLDAAEVADHWYPLRTDVLDAVGSVDGTIGAGAQLQTRYAIETDASRADSSMATDSGDGRVYIADSVVAGSVLAYVGEARRLSVISAPTV